MNQIPAQRLHNHRLEGDRLRAPAEVVRWLGAVQAQEYAHARWGLALRSADATDAAIERDFNDGVILRTHLMRPTWHFVLPEDIRWMLSLTGPRVNAQNGGRYRDLELDEATLQRGTAIMAKALAGGNFLTRPELGAVLNAAGIQTSGQRLAYLVMRAELDAVVCSGPRRGKQFTYALLDERAPGAKDMPREEALARLVRRYFTSHGPAQIHDFVWWSGLTVADTRAGLAMNKDHLVEQSIGGKPHWQGSPPSEAQTAPFRAILLPPYDEYISYKDRSTILEPGQVMPNINELFNGPLSIQGIIVGTWRRSFVRGGVLVEVRPFRPLSPDEHEAVQAAAAHYGEYLGLLAELRIS